MDQNGFWAAFTSRTRGFDSLLAHQLYEAAEARPREEDFALFPTRFPVQPAAVEVRTIRNRCPVLAVMSRICRGVLTATEMWRLKLPPIGANADGRDSHES
jgi:squalene cyclase